MKKINWKYEPNKDSTLSSSAPVLLFEKRVLSVVTLFIILGLITWLIAVSTDYWFITVYYNHTDLLWTHSGLWKKCDIDVNFVKTCEYLSQNVILASSFIIVAIVLLLISLSCGFSVYSLYHPRYTFKRLSGGLHLFTAVMFLVWILNYIPKPVKSNSPAQEKDYYGYSYLLAWISFIISLIASVAFFAWSTKRKHLAHDQEIHLK